MSKPRDLLAKILWEIRANQFPEWNRYSDDVGSYPGEEDLSWDTLQETSVDPNLVSKDHYRRMAKDVLSRLTAEISEDLWLDILTGESLGETDET
jgi:hypothetical protein